MRIQPITSFSTNRNYVSRVKKSEEPQNQPNFKGLKGFVAGSVIGGGITALGVALLTGGAGLPVFLGYIGVNGLLGGASGHMIESENKKDKEEKD